MQNLLDELTKLLRKDERFVSEGKLLKNVIVESALKLDPALLKLLISNKPIKKHFFEEVDEVLVFDKTKFQKFISNKTFLPDSYTAFKNKIGLTVDNEYISEGKEVVLSWPYKDCALEGGQTKEDEKREEIFWNETLAPDEIDRLLSPKVFTNFKKYDSKGEHKLTKLSLEDNLILKGNNLLALHSLLPIYRERIKLIYIDPPYNTGSDSFQYNDSFNHSTWLTFMKNRLEIAKELLSKEGSIFIQIDYKEVAYLIATMNELFGRDNFVQLISVKTASPAGFKTVNPGPIDVTEYILFYTKSKPYFNFKKSFVPIFYDSNYNLVIKNKEDKPENWILTPLRYIIYEEGGIEIGKSDQQTNKNAEEKWGKYWKIIREQLMSSYALENSDIVVSIRDPHKPTEKLKKLLDMSKIKRDKIFIYERSKENNEDEGNEGYVINGGSLSFYSKKIKTLDGQKTATELLTDFWSDISWDGIAKEGGVKMKNGKKPEKLIKRIIEIATDSKKDIILDFFSGSGTTCSVAHKLGYKYVGVEQLDYGENDTLIRLQNVINCDASGISKFINWSGGGSFTYCELAELNQQFIKKINSAKTTKELKQLWEAISSGGFISYKIHPQSINNNANEFEQLSIEDQKKFLIEVLDKNMLYVNYSEIDDKDYKISEEDKKLNKQFYNLK